VPAGHKVAIRAIAAGEAVRRYGEHIGLARTAIVPGEHVHTHNVAFDAGALNYEFPAAERSLPAPPSEMPTFLGYPRADGRVGTRNHIAVVAASNCAAYAAELIARSYAGAVLPPNIDGVAAFPHGEGCGHSIGPDTAQLQRTLAGVLNHPNVGGAIVLGLGCEVNQVEHYLGSNNPDPSRISGFTMQDAGGTQAAVDAARATIGKMMERISAEPRVPVPASKIGLGLQCGGSDSFSGITANPALGFASDLLAELGASSVLAETPEIVGAEHLLVRRARSRAVAERLLEIIAQYRAYLSRFGGSFDDNPSPGNKEGGLTNIVEKSLGAVAKGGTSMLNEVLDYTERITSPGLVFMNTPGYDPVSLSGLAAGGANVFDFTPGRGRKTGFPTVHTI
jgi:altronate hydrolase